MVRQAMKIKKERKKEKEKKKRKKKPQMLKTIELSLLYFFL